jgi:hypothetical protein
MTAIKTLDDMEEFAELYHELSFWQHCHEILCAGDHDDRRKVVDAIGDMQMIERNSLFKTDFDFSRWLRNFINGEPQSEPERIKISIS